MTTAITTIASASTAVATYNGATRLLAAFDTEIEEDAEYLVSCLETARTEGRRWQVGDNARHALTRLPAPADVIAALRALEADQESKPSLEQRLELVSTMCDIWSIEPPVRFIKYVAEKLGGFTTATLVNAIDTALMALEPQNGRPPAPAVLLALARRIAGERAEQCETLNRLALAQRRLAKVVAETKDVPRPANYTDDDDDVPF
jgi:hypothetical protein